MAELNQQLDRYLTELPESMHTKLQRASVPFNLAEVISPIDPQQLAPDIKESIQIALGVLEQLGWQMGTNQEGQVMFVRKVIPMRERKAR